MRFGRSEIMHWLKRSVRIGSERDDYQRAMRRALSRKPFLDSNCGYLTREEIHDRVRARAEANAARENP